MIADVYRIENSRGEGPYKGRPDDWQEEPHNSDTGRPGPYNDGISLYGDSWERFAFLSMAQLKKWFTKNEIRALADSGYIIRRFRKVRILSWSVNQCTFDYNTRGAVTYDI